MKVTNTMKRLAIVLALLIGPVLPAMAEDYSSEVALQINQVYTEVASYSSSNYPTVIVTVTNRSAYSLRYIIVQCTFLSNGVPAITASGIIVNVPSGWPATETIQTVSNVLFDSATCRVSSARR